MADETYLPKRGTVDIRGGLAALAQGLTAMGGEQVPYYTNYLDAQAKRQATEEAMRQFQIESQQKELQSQIDIGYKLGLQLANQNDLNRLATERTMSANINPTQSKPTILGGKPYIPSPNFSSIMEPIIWDPNTQKYTTASGGPVSSVRRGQPIRSAAISPETFGARKEATENVAQKYFKEPEIADIRDISDTRDTLKEVYSGLESIGVKDPSKYGSIEMERIDSNFGPISIPARFNLVGQYAKDPKYTAIKGKLERAFNKYRKIITGAQASYQELGTLRKVFASFSERPGVFFENLKTLTDETDRMLNTRFDLYDSVGRDTSKLRKLYQGQEQQDLKVGGTFQGKKILSVTRVDK